MLDDGGTMEALLNDAAAAGVVTGVLGLVGIVMWLPALWWEATFSRRLRAHEVLKELCSTYYDGCYDQRFGTEPKHSDSVRELYDFDRLLALDAGVASMRRNIRLAARVAQVDVMSDAERGMGYELAQRWVDLTGRFARASGPEHGWRSLPLRGFLQTYHLQVIREGALVEPFLVHRVVATGRPCLDDAVWGLALMDLARRYNSVARQQREAVLFEVGDVRDARRVVRPPPRRWQCLVLTLVDHVSPGFRLYPWRHKIADRRVRSAVMRAKRAASS
jgi:hypothetical protein